MKHLNKVLTVVLIFTIVFTNVVTSTEKVKADEEESTTSSNFCLFCDSSDDDGRKEKQFAERLKIIKDIFGDSIDTADLAATVLYLKFDEGVDRYYDEDFDEENFKNQWTDLFNNLSSSVSASSVDGAGEDENADKIDILTAATIVMALSNGLETYDRDKYKEALMLDKGFTSNEAINVAMCNPVSRVVGSLLSTIFGVINNLNPFNSNKTNFLKYVSTMNDICDHGFLEANYSSVSDIEDADKRKYKKEQVVDSILETSDMYKPWFNISDDPCDGYGTGENSISAGDISNWRQAGESWSSIKIGTSKNDTIEQIGCTTVSMAYLMQKSGTMVTESSFDPGKFAKKVKYTDNGSLKWNSLKNIAPNWKNSENTSIKGKSAKNVASIIKKALNTSLGNNNQAFIIIQMTNHWVAVDHVEGDTVYVLDPAASGTGLVTLQKALDDADDRNTGKVVLENYRTFYATDVAYSGNGNASVKANTSLDYSSDTYKTRLENLNEKYNQKNGSIKDTTVTVQDTSGHDVERKMNKSGSMIASLSAIYYMYNGQDADALEIWQAAITDGAYGTDGDHADKFDTATGTPKITEKVGLSGTKIDSGDKALENIQSTLTSGTKILVNVKGGKYNSKKNGSYIMLDHYDESNKKIYVFDPGSKDNVGYTDLDTVKKEIVNNIQGMWAISSDTVNGTNNYCDVSDVVAEGLSTDLGEGKKINVPNPVPLREGGTMKQSGIHWDDVEYPNYETGGKELVGSAGKVYNAWSKEKKSSKGIAVLKGRYLAATSSMFGKTGDAVDVVLEDGQVIKLVIADTKGDDAESVWGHQQNNDGDSGKSGISMVEWEGYNGYDSVNPPFPKWTGKIIKYVINYGSYLKKIGA